MCGRKAQSHRKAGPHMSSVRYEACCQARGANSYKRSTKEYDVLVSATLVPHGKETATQQTSLGFPKTATFLNPSTLYWSFQSLPLKGEGSFRVVILTGKHQVLPLTRNRVAVVNPVPDGSVRKDVD